MPMKTDGANDTSPAHDAASSFLVKSERLPAAGPVATPARAAVMVKREAVPVLALQSQDAQVPFHEDRSMSVQSLPSSAGDREDSMQTVEDTLVTTTPAKADLDHACTCIATFDHLLNLM